MKAKVRRWKFWSIAKVQEVTTRFAVWELEIRNGHVTVKREKFANTLEQARRHVPQGLTQIRHTYQHLPELVETWM